MLEVDRRPPFTSADELSDPLLSGNYAVMPVKRQEASIDMSS